MKAPKCRLCGKLHWGVCAQAKKDSAKQLTVNNQTGKQLTVNTIEQLTVSNPAKKQLTVNNEQLTVNNDSIWLDAWPKGYKTSNKRREYMRDYMRRKRLEA